MEAADVTEYTSNGWTEELIRSLKTSTLEDLQANIYDTGHETVSTNGYDDPEIMLFLDEIQYIGKIVDEELELRKANGNQ